MSLLLAGLAFGIFAFGGAALEPVAALILLGGALVAIAVALGPVAVFAYQLRQAAVNVRRTDYKGILDYAVLAGLPFVVLLGGVITYASIVRAGSTFPDALAITFFLAFSVIALLLALSMTAIFFSWARLADSRFALGLPEGSVRAVIALALIVIFAIAAIFLYSQVSTTGTITQTGLTSAEVAAIRQAVPAAELLETTLEPGTEEDPRFTVTRLDPARQAGNDLAQQIVTTVSTLVVAVSAFYFGTSSVRAAADAVSGAGGLAIRVTSPKGRVMLQKVGNEYQTIEVQVETTPPYQAVSSEIALGDPRAAIAQIRPGVFRYAPRQPAEEVLLRFQTAADPTVQALLLVERGPEPPAGAEPPPAGEPQAGAEPPPAGEPPAGAEPGMGADVEPDAEGDPQRDPMRRLMEEAADEQEERRGDFFRAE